MYNRVGEHDSDKDIHEQHEHEDNHNLMEHYKVEPEIVQQMHRCPCANNCPMLHMNMMNNRAMSYGDEMEDPMDYDDMDQDMMNDEDDEDSRQFFIRPPRPYYHPYHPYPRPRPRPFFFNLYPPYPPYPPYPYYSPYHHHDYDDYDDYDEY